MSPQNGSHLVKSLSGEGEGPMRQDQCLAKDPRGRGPKDGEFQLRLG